MINACYDWRDCITHCSIRNGNITEATSFYSNLVNNQFGLHTSDCAPSTQQSPKQPTNAYLSNSKKWIDCACARASLLHCVFNCAYNAHITSMKCVAINFYQCCVCTQSTRVSRLIPIYANTRLINYYWLGFALCILRLFVCFVVAVFATLCINYKIIIFSCSRSANCAQL